MSTVNIVSHRSEKLASHRMRCMIPMQTLNTYTTFKTEITQSINSSADINIIHKHFEPSKTISDTIMSRDLTKIVFDICDDWFDREHGDYYETMCDLADVVTCHTTNMQNRIYDVTGRLAQICADPITFPRHEPSPHNEKPSLLWHGHSSNIFSIVPYFETLENLTVISNTRLNSTKIKSKYWKPDLVEGLIDNYDIVLIPRIHSAEAVNKSPNRAVDALHSGRFVIAESEEVYGEFVDFLYLGSIEDGIKFYKENPEEVRDMILAGQKYVIDNYNHKKVCEQWVSAINYEDYSKYGR